MITIQLLCITWYAGCCLQTAKIRVSEIAQTTSSIVDYKVQNFENLTFFCRLDTTNWSVLNFSALRAATFIEKYIEIQMDRQKGAKKVSALRAATFIQKTIQNK